MHSHSASFRKQAKIEFTLNVFDFFSLMNQGEKYLIFYESVQTGIFGGIRPTILAFECQPFQASDIEFEKGPWYIGLSAQLSQKNR